MSSTGAARRPDEADNIRDGTRGDQRGDTVRSRRRVAQIASYAGSTLDLHGTNQGNALTDTGPVPAQSGMIKDGHSRYRRTDQPAAIHLADG